MMNRIMLRFRPIAPKPTTGGSSSDGSAMDNKNAFISKGRTKRKYVRVRKNNNNSGSKRKGRIAEEEMKEALDLDMDMEKAVVTLQLMPEKSERNESPESASWCNIDPTVPRKDCEENGDAPIWLNLDEGVSKSNDKDRTVVESWVTVESVTDTCMGVGVLGSTDVERMRNLEEDTCPGFVSDGFDRVVWVNGAFKRMVSQQNDGQSPESNNNNKKMMVWLVAKDKLPYLHAAFTCQVKLQYTCKKDKYSQIVPCDVWRMDGGGFAWRLDVEAALSLGR